MSKISSLICLAIFVSISPLQADLRLAVFDVDATPPTGSHLTYDPMIGVGELSLRCRGIVLTGAEQPIVLCAVDWIGIANEGHDAFRQALAEAAGTTRERVAVHTLHQHDSPICDFTSEKLLVDHGMPSIIFDAAITKPTIARAVEAVREALPAAKPVTHIGFGRGEVKEVASNRRVMGPDGKVKAVRYTACKDPALRAEPEGIIDPFVSLVSFWNGDQPLVVLSYYATHPQSYYRTGLANPDFPGVARFLREQAVPGVLQVHFDGAGGNIGAGKYNDGSPENRPVLATRLAAGMARAWAATEKFAITAAQVGWQVEPVALPPAGHLNGEQLDAQLSGAADKAASILGSAEELAWLRRCQAGHKIDIACLRLGNTRILHLPGELFVEYQLAAQKMRPELRVALAAYGDYGPGYIGTEIAYSQGGYETQPSSSFVAPGVEKVLMDAMRKLLMVNSE